MVEKKRMPNDNGVIINVYVESRIRRSGRINPVRLPSQRCAVKTRGYDRRAQLLAYAQQLRRADPERLRMPRGKSKMKRRWGVAAERIKRLFSRIRGGAERQWKYEPIGREDCSDGEGKWSCGRRRKSRFCKKLMCLLKKISGSWRCSRMGATN